jgi:hypothetical protein
MPTQRQNGPELPLTPRPKNDIQASIARRSPAFRRSPPRTEFPAGSATCQVDQAFQPDAAARQRSVGCQAFQPDARPVCGQRLVRLESLTYQLLIDNLMVRVALHMPLAATQASLRGLMWKNRKLLTNSRHLTRVSGGAYPPASQALKPRSPPPTQARLTWPKQRFHPHVRRVISADRACVLFGFARHRPPFKPFLHNASRR